MNMAAVHEILIADRNPRVREFLRRELTAIGYHVRLVNSGKELLKLIYSHTPVDLLVLDPDFPCADVAEMLGKIADRVPQLPVVIHCVRGSADLARFPGGQVIEIEKNGNSIEILKETINAVLPDDRDLPSDAPPGGARGRSVG